MKKIYIVLTYTGTMLSKLIKLYTKDEFAHVSIATDLKLENMYSFGRLHPYNPLFGGFVHEGIHIGTFKRFKNTKTNIYSLEVNDEQFNKINNIIKDIKSKENCYKFNTFGLFAVGLGKRIYKKNSFYCAEFVKYTLEKSGIKTNLPNIIRPDNFKDLENIKLMYRGKLKEYIIN